MDLGLYGNGRRPRNRTKQLRSLRNVKDMNIQNRTREPLRPLRRLARILRKQVLWMVALRLLTGLLRREALSPASNDLQEPPDPEFLKALIKNMSLSLERCRAVYYW